MSFLGVKSPILQPTFALIGLSPCFILAILNVPSLFQKCTQLAMKLPRLSLAQKQCAIKEINKKVTFACTQLYPIWLRKHAKIHFITAHANMCIIGNIHVGVYVPISPVSLGFFYRFHSHPSPFLYLKLLLYPFFNFAGFFYYKFLSSPTCRCLELLFIP